MRRCFISKNYKEIKSAGNKAKTDMEDIMSQNGFVNIGCRRTYSSNLFAGYFLTLLSVVVACFRMRKDDIIVIQYPFKKYYTFLCKAAHLRGAKVITLIHDLGAFRRKRLTVAEEKKRLSNTDGIITPNEFMSKWLTDHGYTQPVSFTGFWDYLSEAKPAEKSLPDNFNTIIHAGSLSEKKHSFMYKLDKELSDDSCKFVIYGGDFKPELVEHKNNFIYKGFVHPDDMIRESAGDFGLIWYGHSTDEIDGVYGEYLKITSSHKPSLYILCHIPLIVWDQSAMWPLVKEYGVGISISSLKDLDSVLRNMTHTEYRKIIKNIHELSNKISSGYFFLRAYHEVELRLLNNEENNNHTS